MQKSNIIYANYKPLLLKPTTTKAVIVTSSGRGKWKREMGKEESQPTIISVIVRGPGIQGSGGMEIPMLWGTNLAAGINKFLLNVGQ